MLRIRHVVQFWLTTKSGIFVYFLFFHLMVKKTKIQNYFNVYIVLMYIFEYIYYIL